MDRDTGDDASRAEDDACAPSADGGGARGGAREGAQLSSGVGPLDEALGGGFAPGAVVALTAAPAAQSEPIAHAFAAAHPHRYLALQRPAAAVEGDAAAAGLDLSVEAVDDHALLRDPEGHLSGLDPGAAVVVDPVTDLEGAGESEYRAFLRALARAVGGVDGVALLHCPELSPATLRRDLTLLVADVVCDFRVEYDAEGRATPAVTVPKRRRGRPAPEGVPLAFGEGGGVRGGGDVDDRSGGSPGVGRGGDRSG